jgi:hypothetical protein
MEPTKNFGGMLESSIARREGGSDPWGDVSEVGVCSSNFVSLPVRNYARAIRNKFTSPREGSPQLSRKLTFVYLEKRRGC